MPFDEAALLTCMSYVDLNPARAGLADMPETSDFTSIQERIRHYLKQHKKMGNTSKTQFSAPKGLLPFTGREHQDKKQCMPFKLADYLELTDWAVRAIKEDKAGVITSLDRHPLLSPGLVWQI
jgi:hypothetical protein